MSEKTVKDTVRNRQKKEAAAVQRFLPVAEIRNNAIILKNGGLRGIIEVEALNFNLKSETEQQGIIAGYGAFVNTLGFPLQIVIRSTRTNIDEYLAQVKEIGSKHKTELLRNQTANYVAFMQKLIEVADIMQKRFYVVVPVDQSARKHTMIERFLDWMHPDDSASKATARNKNFAQGLKQLNERMELVSSGLNNIGLHVKRMETKQILELLYQVYNPKASHTQKLPEDLEKLEVEKLAL